MEICTIKAEIGIYQIINKTTTKNHFLHYFWQHKIVEDSWSTI
jgi:hypothetical protein